MTSLRLTIVLLLHLVGTLNDFTWSWPQVWQRQQWTDPPWSWGYVDETTAFQTAPTPRTTPRPRPTSRPQPTTQPRPSPRPRPTPRPRPPNLVSSTTVTVASTPDPCAPFHRKVPDFRAKDRRVSHVKCHEIVWGIKYRVEKGIRQAKCDEKRTGIIVLGGAIGGRNAKAGEFPHMGAIGWKAVAGTWVFKCGGSLISEKFVLSAAHCTSLPTIDDSVADIKPKIVRLGDTNILDKPNDPSPVDANILRSIVHPHYNSPEKYNDIALFELDKPIKEFTFLIHPACLWFKPDTVSFGKNATVTGWGVIDVDKQTTSPVLQAAVVDIIGKQQCNQLLRTWFNRNWCGVRDQICAGKLEGGVDSCQGDSGGPLQVQVKLPRPIHDKLHYVVGVTSFGMGCARAKSPGVYTRVSSFIDWIERIVWP